MTTDIEAVQKAVESSPYRALSIVDRKRVKIVEEEKWEIDQFVDSLFN